MSEYLGVIVTFFLAAVVGGAFLLLASVLGPKRPSAAKAEPFECGKEPLALPAGRLPVKFYLVGMLFILFDIELVFLFPWAVVCRKLGLVGFVEMGAFLGVVILAFVYALQKGALEWQ
ncbi:MAG: NADH-quinone oxidoreductase subunit A [Candidatus Omnitrophica bacterium]|nr:NADH-quinone oxidoreductase subunit A [Candidatus Omnitrophota bacterium]